MIDARDDEIVDFGDDLIVDKGALLETKDNATQVAVHVIAFLSGIHRPDGGDGGVDRMAVDVVIGVVGLFGDTGGDADASAGGSVEGGQSHVENECSPRGCIYSLHGSGAEVMVTMGNASTAAGHARIRATDIDPGEGLSDRERRRMALRAQWLERCIQRGNKFGQGNRRGEDNPKAQGNVKAQGIGGTDVHSSGGIFSDIGGRGVAQQGHNGH